MEKQVQHQRPLILAGFVIAQAVGWFILFFLLPAFWNIELIDERVSLLFFGYISLGTFMNAIGGYFWALAGLKRQASNNLAFLNSLPLWILIITHPEFQQDVFFIVAFFILNFFCALLGNWFGIRFFFD